jgi:hypothetical protein
MLRNFTFPSGYAAVALPSQGRQGGVRRETNRRWLEYLFSVEGGDQSEFACHESFHWRRGSSARNSVERWSALISGDQRPR